MSEPRRQSVPRSVEHTDELVPFLRRLAVLGVALLALLAAGTIGFVVTEGVSVGYGFVWTLDTVATVGTIPDPGDAGGHALKVVLEILGVGTLFYGLVTVTEFFVAGHIIGLLDDRRQRKLIATYDRHYIICGFGRVGRQVARDLRAAGQRFVVIDGNPANREYATGVDVRFLEGEPSDEEMLLQAGIERAKGVIACVDSDAENIFITLTAKGVAPEVFVVARAAAEASERKLQRAGADRVISPYKASGAEMARIVLHPQVGGAFDVAQDYRMEEIDVTPGCDGAGRTIGDIRGGSVIVALRKADGTMEPQPAAESMIEPGDRLVALGTPATLERLETLFQPAGGGSA